MIRPNKRRFTFATYLLSGYLPWGRDFRREGEMPRIGRFVDDGRPSWPLCCGHVMSDSEVAQWVAEGLAEMRGGEDVRWIVAGPNLERWVSDAWHGLTVQRWAPKRD